MKMTAVEAMSRRGFAAARALAPTEEQWGTALVDLYEQTLVRRRPWPGLGIGAIAGGVVS